MQRDEVNMGRTAYEKLAIKLDQLPNHYPKTKSGIEILLLEKIFSPREAALAGEMSFNKEPAAVIAARAGIPEKEAKEILKGMVKKRLILFSRGESELLFGLMPFVVGFYEELLPRLNAELAELFESYFQETQGMITGEGLSVHRVIPVQESIDFEMEVFPYEKASDLIMKAKSWGVRDCICRVQKKLTGDPCEHPLNNCLVFAPVEDAFDTSEVDRPISQEEALQILHEAEQAGLVHTTGNYQEGVNYICNCCTCSCGILRSVAEFNRSTAVARSGFLVVVDEDLCLACEDCLERCQFDALYMNEVCRVDITNCVGCGLCVTACPEGALALIRRPVGEVATPPLDIRSWGIARLSGG